jgi:peroxiredoxin
MKSAACALLLAALAVPMFAAAPVVPRPAREFTFVEPSGKQTLVSTMKGKVVVIQFLYTTCPHCQALSRELTKMTADFAGKPVQFIGVAFDEANAMKAANYVKQFGVGFPVSYASRETVMSYLGLSVMDRFVVPQMMIIDKKGTIRAQSDPMGTEQLQQASYLTTFINGLLKEGGASSSVTQKTPVAVANSTK